MNNLATVPKNGTLSNRNSNGNYTKVSTWLDEIFNQDLPAVLTPNFNSALSLPKVNIRETADAFMVEMAVPGLKKSDFHIDLDHQVLSISTKPDEVGEQHESSYTRKEFGYSPFKRNFTLPESVNDEKINASYENGILSILLPKKEEAKQRPARNIQVS